METRASSAARSRWVNPSVLALGVDEPVKWITERARALVFRAIEAGWSGPPFDPIALAGMLNIPVHPSQEVLDARLVPQHGGARIDFNPNRPPGRIRYSIAHEIGHSLFPDHLASARHRVKPGHLDKGSSELEMLCNLAAAELLMPIGSFPEARSAALGIDSVLDLRERYDLSTEAVLLRVGRLASDPVGVFAAAPRGKLAADGYRIDYMIAPEDTPVRARRGDLVPAGSAVQECTAVGFTAKGTERWPRTAAAVRVECVGIPPYPGQSLPRVAGLLLETGPHETPHQAIRFLVGDATEPRGPGSRIIVQIVNDATPRWGGGFSREIHYKWRQVENDFQEWSRQQGGLHLGALHVSEVAQDLAVASMVAQHGYGTSARPRIRYAALQQCLRDVANVALQRGASVHAPRIGAGQAGGNWAIIEEMISDALVARGIDVTIYDLPGASRPSGEQADHLQIPLALAT